MVKVVVKCKYARVKCGYRREGEKTASRQSNVIGCADYFSERRDVNRRLSRGVPLLWVGALSRLSRRVSDSKYILSSTTCVAGYIRVCWVCMCSTYELLGKLILIFEVLECWSVVHKVRLLMPRVRWLPGRVYCDVVMCCAYLGITSNQYLGVLHYTTLCFRTAHNTACVAWVWNTGREETEELEGLFQYVTLDGSP